HARNGTARKHREKGASGKRLRESRKEYSGMSFNKSLRVTTFIFAGAFALLARPGGTNARVGWQTFAQSPENATAEPAKPENGSEMQGDREQEQQDREQEKRDREQELRDREQEKKDR